jgi:hypothetical protein
MIDNQTNREDYLLSCPAAVEDGELDVIERYSCSYQNKSERFLLKEKNFNRQYSHIYAVRLMEMRDRLKKAAERKWGEHVIRFLGTGKGGGGWGREIILYLSEILGGMQGNPNVMITGETSSGCKIVYYHCSLSLT